MGKKWIKTIGVLCVFSLSASAFALPSFSRVVSGSANLVWGTDSLTIETTGDTAIEWNTFDLGVNEHLYFNQPAADNWVWNTVLDSAPTEISGAITSNGGFSLSAPNLFWNGSIKATSIALMGATVNKGDSAIVDVAGGNLPKPACDLGLGSSATISIGGFVDDRSIACAVRGIVGPAVMIQFPPPLLVAVPEPETYAMLLAGLGLMGAIARRRRGLLA